MSAQDIETLPSGALNPVIDTRMDLLPPRALLAAARALKGGMKYDKRPENWRGVPACEHLNHALRHIMLHQAHDDGEDHIGHTVSRILMWAELSL